MVASSGMSTCHVAKASKVVQVCKKTKPAGAGGSNPGTCFPNGVDNSRLSSNPHSFLLTLNLLAEQMGRSRRIWMVEQGGFQSVLRNGACTK